MKTKATESSSTSKAVNTQSHAPTFAKVLDARKQPIRALWVRNGRFYAQLKIENPITGIKKTKRVPLVDKDGNAARTTAEAVAELKRLQTQRSDNALPVLARTPKFGEYAAKLVTDNHKAELARWSDAIGQLRLDQIKRVHVNRFIEKRQTEKPAPSNRTINLDVIALRVVLKRALEDGLIQRLPTEGLRPLKTTTPKRSLVTSAEIEALCTAAFGTKKNKDGSEVSVTQNAVQFADYIRLMAYSGARRNEALGLQWSDVDFKNSQLYFHRQITAKGVKVLKNREARAVDFNPKLKAHLEDMQNRKAPDSQWLFPSPQRGDKDIPSKTFRESLEFARAAAKMPNVNFHDCRHHFISMCVMSGIDYMTIAAWVGHKDGGILIGKVYGHLANEHRQAMAEKLTFEPTIVQKAANQ